MIVDLIKSDLKRYEEEISFKKFIRYFIFTPGFKYSVYFRIANHLAKKKSKFAIISKIILKRKGQKYGIQIPEDTQIGEGLLIRHYGTIFINPEATVGKNLIISQGVTIGVGKNGSPKIGNNVHIAPGAKILGGITIGDNVVIGANSVVVKDVPSNAVVGGVPSKVLYYKE